MPTPTFTPHAPHASAPAASWRAHAIGALDGSAFSIPASLGAATLVFSHTGFQFLPAGLLAMFLALVVTHLAAAWSARPMVYSARFFEATTLAAMLDQFAVQMPVWNVPVTSGTRIALLCLVVGSAGIFVAVLYLLGADRFTRFIPAPVFAGFSNAIAIALIASQWRTLAGLLADPSLDAPVITTVFLVFGTGLVLRRLRPRWPASALALLVGLLLGLGWTFAHVATPMIGTFGWVSTLPFMLADFHALTSATAHTWAVGSAVATSGAILGTMMFINSTMTAQVLAQSDAPAPRRRAGNLLPVLAGALTGFAGAMPLSGSMNASAIAAKHSPLNGASMGFCAAVAGLVYLSGIVGLIPLAAVSGALLCEAWLLLDRGSMRMFGNWLRRRPMTENAREDLALIFAVMAAAVLENMVAAVFVGLLLGLVLFAARNARRPVRNVWTGGQMASVCARSRADLQVLAQHGDDIRVFELEGDLFFGSTDALERVLGQHTLAQTVPVVDWSRVRHIDTSVALAIARYEKRVRAQGVAPIHAGLPPGEHELATLLRMPLPHALEAPDRDRALELAENEVLRRHGRDTSPEVTSMLDAAILFKGLDEAERTRLEAAMEQRTFKAGETIMKAGEPGDEMMLVLFGSASIIGHTPEGESVRIAGVRRGATLGELAFLDRAQRSATVVASEDTLVAVLGRAQFERLSQEEPHLVHRLLANIAASIAERLRHTNRLALARQNTR